MIDKLQLALLAQIIMSMEEAFIKLEEAHKEKNAEDFDKAKIAILEFQRRLDQEIREEERKVRT